VTVLHPSHVTDAEPSAPATTLPAAGLTDLIDEALGRLDHWQDAPGALRRALRALLGPLTELARQDAALAQAVAEARATERSASQLLAILRATAVAAPAPGARAVDPRRTDALCEQVRATLTQLQNTLNRPPRSMF
jgi:hypothetical protein